MSETYILCEGYHDRAFWKGMLCSIGCVSRPEAADPWGRKVSGGQYAIQSANGAFLRIVPALGRSNLLRLSGERLADRVVHELRRLVVSSDSDTNADGTPTVRGELQFATILELAKQYDPAAREGGAHTISLDGDATRIIVFPWKATEPPTAGLPNQQSLERLICSAIGRVHGARKVPVQQWLDGRPSPPKSHPKEHLFSYLAGWYAETGSYEGFCEKLWADAPIAAAIKEHLKAYGVWALVEEIAQSA